MLERIGLAVMSDVPRPRPQGITRKLRLKLSGENISRYR